MRVRAWTIGLVVLSLTLSSCSWFDRAAKTSWHGKVGDGVVTAEVGDVTVIFPDGVAPAGTEASVELKPRSEESRSATSAVSQTVEVSLDGGLQPAVPVTISIPVQAEGVDTAEFAEGYLLIGSSVSGSGDQSYFTGSFDAATGTYSMTVNHFSSFKVLGIDIGAALNEVRTSIMQGIGLEFPAPDCVGAPALVGHTIYEAPASDTAHVCVAEDQGSLVVTAYPAVAMPYLVTTLPQAEGVTAGDEVNVGTAGVIAIARALGLIDSGSETGLFPGAKAIYTFDGIPQSVQLHFDQYPVLLLMVILAKTLDAIGVTSIEALDGLQCLADVADSNAALNDGVNGESVAAFARSFFTCAGTVGDLTLFGRVVLAALGAAPTLFITGCVGLVNELSGNDDHQIDLIVTKPALRTDDDFLNAGLPANVCWAADRGWPHDHGIQLVGGTGIARTSDGSFEGASVIRSSVLGRADIDGNGSEEVVMSLLCSGSLPETCCAGRSSTMTTVVVFTVQNGDTLKQVASSLMGGSSEPGDKYGPAPRKITSVELRGTTVVTTESVIYPLQYTPDQVGGDPYQPVTVEYNLKGGNWSASRP